MTVVKIVFTVIFALCALINLLAGLVARDRGAFIVALVAVGLVVWMWATFP